MIFCNDFRIFWHTERMSFSSFEEEFGTLSFSFIFFSQDKGSHILKKELFNACEVLKPILRFLKCSDFIATITPTTHPRY